MKRSRFDVDAEPFWQRSESQEENVQTDSTTTAHDGLDDYIRVGSPGLLIIVGALSLMLVATLIWGFFGKIPVTHSATGCVCSKAAALLPEEPENSSASGFGNDGIIIPQNGGKCKFSP